MIIDGSNVQILARVQENILCFYQDVQIDHFTHVTGPVDQYSAESEFNAVCTLGMSLSNFKMLANELNIKDPYLVTEQAPLE